MAIVISKPGTTTQNGTTGTTSTVTSVPFGTASANRLIAIPYEIANGTVPSAATIGGVSAHIQDFGGVGAGWIYAMVPSGTSGNVVFTLPSSDTASVLRSYSLSGVDSATAADTLATLTTSGTIDVPAGGALIALSAATDTSGSWAGVTLDERVETDIYWPVGTFLNTGGAITNRTVSYSDALGITAVSFTPVSTGTQTLEPSLLTNSQSFKSPTVKGKNTLAPSELENTNEFFSASVSSKNTLSPSKLTNTQTFYSPSVSIGGDQTLSPELFTNSSEFFGPTIGGKYTLEAPKLTNSQTFYSPVVKSAAYELYPSLVPSSNAFFGPKININLKPGLFENENSFFSPTIASIYSLEPDLFENINEFFGPSIRVYTSLKPDLFTNSNTFYSPRVALEAQEIVQNSPFINENTLFGPVIEAGQVVLRPAFNVNINWFFNHEIGFSGSTGGGSSTGVPPQKYVPEPIPQGSATPAFTDYIFRELLRISANFELSDSVILAKLSSEPSKPADGTLVYADGSNWDPGSGEGFYGRIAGEWVYLHA